MDVKTSFMNGNVNEKLLLLNQRGRERAKTLTMYVSLKIPFMDSNRLPTRSFRKLPIIPVEISAILSTHTSCLLK